MTVSLLPLPLGGDGCGAAPVVHRERESSLSFWFADAVISSQLVTCTYKEFKH